MNALDWLSGFAIILSIAYLHGKFSKPRRPRQWLPWYKWILVNRYAPLNIILILYFVVGIITAIVNLLQ